MSDESSDTPSQPPRASRFREHTNTSNSIRPPPDELWKDLGIDNLIDKFNEENEAQPATSRTSSGNSVPELRRLHSDNIKKWKEQSASGSGSASGSAFGTETVQPAPAGALGRFQRVWASMLGGVLGKRKAGAVDAEKDKVQQLMDDRKKAAEAAYHAAKEQGLLPTPKVFVRPGMAPMTHNCATPVRSPRTPSLYRSPSKKDLQKQKKLTKRVSNLECKLASARKELYSVLNSDFPPVPTLPSLLPPIPATSQVSHEHAVVAEPTRSPPPIPVSESASESEPESRPSSRSLGRITKKRKVHLSIDDADYIPAPTDSEGEVDMLSVASEGETDELSRSLDHERTIKRVKSSTSSSSRRKSVKKSTTQLQKRNSRTSLSREDMTVSIVPDGVKVPHVPAIPGGVRGKKVVAFDDEADMYGGLEHEMF